MEKTKELNKIKSPIYLIGNFFWLFITLYIIFCLGYTFIKADYIMLNFVNWSEDVRISFVIVFFIICIMFFVGILIYISEIETETGDKCDKKQ